MVSAIKNDFDRNRKTVAVADWHKTPIRKGCGESQNVKKKEMKKYEREKKKLERNGKERKEEN